MKITNNRADTVQQSRISTGVSGLDEILRGGLTGDRLYLIEGTPGAGKTTLALQFLLEGIRLGEPVLYVSLSESRAEIVAIGESHGWDLRAMPVYEVTTGGKSLLADEQLTMFHPSELELTETTRQVLDKVSELKPTRVVFDSLSELRLLAQNALRYRRQILGLKQFFAGRNTTVLLLDDHSSGADNLQLQSIAHGVIYLEQLLAEYGGERRQLRVIKMRGIAFRGGVHDFVIRRGGLEVFPRLVAAEHTTDFSAVDVPSGHADLDRLLGGGLPAGSSTLLLGPAGTGKSTIALQYCLAAAARGECAAVYLFDETIKTMLTRMRKLSMPMEPYIENGLITVQQIDPAELSPGEFAGLIRAAVETKGARQQSVRTLMIDSLNGYLNSMVQEKQLTAQLHELFTYLNQNGVSTLLTVTQSGMIGNAMHTPVDTTYLADNVVLFRYFESFGEIRKAISVAKKRSGHHETTIRELRTDAAGVHVGPPLRDFQGVLTGVPTFVGAREELMHKAKIGHG